MRAVAAAVAMEVLELRVNVISIRRGVASNENGGGAIKQAGTRTKTARSPVIGRFDP